MTYQHIPTTSELLDAIKVRRTPSKWDRWIWGAVWTGVGSVFISLVCIGLAHFKWFGKDILMWALIPLLTVMVVASATIFVLSTAKNIGVFQHPAKGMASDIDLESDIKFQFMKNFGQIPTVALLERHHHIEDHLASREKWLHVARWMGVISAAVIVLSGEFIGNADISSWIKTCVTLVLVGFALGAISIHVGITELKRLSFVLRKLGEHRQTDEMRRKQKRRR